MIFTNFITALFLCINSLEASKSSKSKKKKSSSSRQQDESSHEVPDRFVSEEYGRHTFIAERMGPYQVVYMPKRVETVPESELFLKKESKKNENLALEKDSKKSKKKGKKVKNAYFNNEVESESETSKAEDEAPRIRPVVTESNVNFTFFVEGHATRHLLQFPNGLGDLDRPNFEDKSDVLADQVRPSNFYTAHHIEFDGFLLAAKKEENIHLWRNPSIHPERVYNRNNEVDPSVPFYDVDVETSQREMQTYFGRDIGRDKKTKLIPDRNSFSSVNDGCVIN